MKKIVSLLLVVFVSLSMLSFAACGDDHKHSYGAWKTEVSATCTKDGKRYKECKCGEKVEDKISALGHNYVGGVCTVCGESK